MQTSGLSGISRLVDSVDASHPGAGARRTNFSAALPAAKSAIGRPARVDDALQRRLAQLRTAMGQQETATMEAAQGGAPEPSASARSSWRGPFQGLTLLSTAVVSALVGAGAAWTAAMSATTSGEAQAPEPRPALAAPAAALIATDPRSPTTLPSPLLSDEEQLADQLDAWRQAWSSRDVEAYLSHYSERFVPSGGLTRAAWVSARRANIVSRASISVNLREVNLERIDENRVRLTFLQDYAAGNYREDGQPKMLELTQEGTVWRIVSERQLKG